MGRRQRPAVDNIGPGITRDVLQHRRCCLYRTFCRGRGYALLYVAKLRQYQKAVISDVNTNLIKAYEVIKYTPERLVGILSKIQDTYWKIPETDKRKEFYLDIRQKFNQGGLSDIDNTAYFIFLNRTCFNGLYRVNSKGRSMFLSASIPTLPFVMNELFMRTVFCCKR